MKIKKIKINSFGKIKNKEIELKEKINIIKGKNESGKSTIFKFILSTLYGISKNKKGKDISDYDKYKPWQGEEFSGKIEYELDNGEKYEIYREFNKKNPQIYNENSEEITNNYNIDKNKGSEFFYEQTRISEELFTSTSAIMQQEVKIEKGMQNILIQKIANLVGTGEDNISYQKAIEKINKRQLEEIGTERSREKPINIIQKEIEEIEKEKKELEKYKDYEYEIEKNKNEIIKKISENEIKNECLNEIKKQKEKNKIEKEKIKIQEEIKNKNDEKIKILKNKIQEINIKEEEQKQKNREEIKKIKNKNKKAKNILNIFFIIIILINIIQMFIIKNKIINYIILSTILIYLIYYIIKIKKINSKNKFIKIEKEDDEKINIENEIKIIKENNYNTEIEIKRLTESTNLKINLEKEKIKNKYRNKIPEKEIIKYINTNEIENIIQELQKQIYNDKIQMHTLEIDKENIEQKLDNLVQKEERLEQLYEQYVNLKKLNSSMELAKEILQNSYEKMKNIVTPKFTQYLSKTIDRITNRKIHKCKI